MGLGAMQLLPIGRKQMLATLPSVARRSRGIVSDGQRRQVSFVATRRFKRGVAVSCAESSVIGESVEATPPPGGSYTEAGIEVVRSIEQAENEVLRAVESMGMEAAGAHIIPVLDVLMTEERGQTQTVAASLTVSEVAKTLERDDKEFVDEAEVVHEKFLHGIEQLTSSVEPSLVAPEMVLHWAFGCLALS